MGSIWAGRASAGLIISEATGISVEGLGWPNAPGIWSDEQVDGWKLVTDTVHKEGGKLLLASSIGKGFVAETSELIAETRKGRQVVNLKGDAKLRVIREIPAEHDHIAAVGENRKLIVFNLEEMPTMARGQGVMLQRYRDGGMKDVKCFAREEGLTWMSPAGRQMREDDLMMWTGKRASAGRMAPRGFNKSGRFS